MAIYVGVTGTHSTGKSTFVRLLKLGLERRGMRVGQVSDLATKCRDVGMPILKDHTFESTLWIMSSVIREELEAGMKAEVVLVDRPVFDALGYLQAALESQKREISQEERVYLYSLASLHRMRYCVVIKSVLNDAIALGTGRDTDLEFRELVDRKIADVLQEVEVKYQLLESHGGEQLAQRIVTLICG